MAVSEVNSLAYAPGGRSPVMAPDRRRRSCRARADRDGGARLAAPAPQGRNEGHQSALGGTKTVIPQVKGSNPSGYTIKLMT